MTMTMKHGDDCLPRSTYELWVEAIALKHRAELRRLQDALVAVQNHVPLKDSLPGSHTCGSCRMCYEITERALHNL